jgi:hypothetical protein
VERGTPRAEGLTLRTLLTWLSLLGLGLVLMAGRYDWHPPNDLLAFQGYVSSAYMFLLVVPTVHSVLVLFAVSQRGRSIASLSLGLILCLPYSWLGLARFRYHAETLNWSDPRVPLPSTQWLTDAHAAVLSVPHEVPLFLLITCAGLGALAAWSRGREPQQQRWGAFLALLFVLIVVQTWLHQSLRSPYTYLCHFEKPAWTNYWYHSYLFPTGQGAVNADNHHFRELEDHFLGIPGPKTFMLLRRSLVFYLSSPFVYFFNPYYVFLIGNIALWWAASVCTFSLVEKWFDRFVAYTTSYLVATGTGFIFYAAQPFNYLMAWALIPIVLWVYERWIDNTDSRWPRVGMILLLGAFLGLCSMAYDIFPFYVFVIGYGMLRRVRFLSIAGSLVVALAVYFGFLWLETGYFRIVMNLNNLRDIVLARDNWLELLRWPTINRIYGFSTGLVELYAGHMAKAFLVLPLIPAIAGILTLRTRVQKVIVALLLVPSVLTVAYFWGGGSYLLGMPRFVYMSFLAVYMLAATGLRALGPSRPARLACAAFLVAIVMLNNADVLGHPKLYYHFYHGGQTTSRGYFESP